MSGPAQDFPDLFNIDAFNARLEAAASRISRIRPYSLESLGQVGGRDILLLSPEIREGLPNILTAGGFHGEEPGGPWGIVEFLETADAETLCRVNHSFLPLVNPTGFECGARNNLFDENSNRGFTDGKSSEATMAGLGWSNTAWPSVEGEILLAHIDRLLPLMRDGFHSQHEDDGVYKSYMYVIESAAPGSLAPAMLSVLARHFPVMADDEGHAWLKGSSEAGFLKEGVWRVTQDIDSSFESYLALRGIPRIVTTETPALESPLARIACNRDLVFAFSDATARICAAPKPVLRGPGSSF